jgi:tetratricopeptide (TPR) repeat protein
MLQRLYAGDHPDVARSLSYLANALHELGEVPRARELHEQALAMRQRLYTGDHRDLAGSLNNLAIDLRRLGERERARDLDEEALAILEQLYAGDHPDVALSLNNLAIDLYALGEHKRALELQERASAIYQRLHDGGRPTAIELIKGGRRTSAAAMFEAAKRENPLDADVRHNYGFCILPDHPEEGLREIHTASELGYNRPDITFANQMFGLFLLQRYSSALEVAERLLQHEENHERVYLWDWRMGAENMSIINVEPCPVCV